MGDAEGSRPVEVLRNAARGGQERFLVALGDGTERPRIAAALGSEGFVLEVDSVSEGLARLADESFDLAILDLPPEELEAETGRSGRDPLAASRELRPFSDLVLISDGDPRRAGQAFAREVAAVLPRPLPEVDALLRAHVKRLAGFRRARTRGLLVLNAFGGVKDELAASEPELGAALEALARESKRDPAIIVLGDAELAEAAGAQRDTASPDVAVVGLAPGDALDTRLGEARARAAGAALVVVDDAPSAERLAIAIYGGARAYLPRAALDLLGRVTAAAAGRRHGESLGVKIVEVLARHGILTGTERTRAPAPQQDVDVRLIADAITPRPHTPSSPPGTRCWSSTTRRWC